MKKKLLFLPIAGCFLVFHSQAQNAEPFWSLAGNSNTTANSKLGTTNAVPLRLLTNDRERMRLDANGKVAIGTTSALGKLTLFNNGSTPASSWITFGNPAFTSFAESTGGNADHIMAMASNTTTARPNLVFKRSKGTLAKPGAVAANDFLASLASSGYDGSGFQNPATIDFFVDGTPSAGSVPARISFSTGSNIGNRTERLTVKANGNVGIGTVTPAYRLSVNGTIQAKEIRVESGWADYVFEKNYKLLPLAEVERFIKKYGHLPGVASARKVREEGLAVAEMTTKMMEKVEELTLYIIELQKQIDQLRKDKAEGATRLPEKATAHDGHL